MFELSHPKERIQWIVDEYYKGHTKRLADAAGIAPATITQINKGVYPSWKVIAAILSIHQEICPDWFIHGKGPRTRELVSGGKLVDLSRVRKFAYSLYHELH